MILQFRAVAIALFGSIVLAGSASAQAGPVKIGYINSAQLLQQAPGRAEAEAQFEREVGAYRQQLQRMNDSLTTLATAFDRDAPKLDSATREVRGRAIRARETEYQTRARDLDQRMQTRQAELVKPIMERVQGVIETIRSEDGYSMILDVGSQVSVVVAADKRLDLTEKVLTRLKAAGPPAAAPAGGVAPRPAGVTRPPTR